MIDAVRDRHVWAESYDRELQDIFAIQSDIAKRVAEELRVRMLPGEEAKLQKGSTVNTEAYTLYLKGRYYLNERTREGMQKAIQYFNEAIRRDSNYALAYSGLADSYMLQENWGYITPAEASVKRRTYATKAIELDDSLAEAHVTLAAMLTSKEWDFVGAEREYRRAIELNPNYATAHHWYANGLLGPQRRFDEAILELREAKRLDPLSPIVAANLGDQLLAVGRHTEAEEQYRSVLEHAPDFAYARDRLGLAMLGESRYEEAISEIQKTVEQRPIDATTDLIYASSLAGRKDEAKKLLKDLESKSNKEFVSNVMLALANAAAGNNDRAIEFLEKAAAERSNQLFINLNEPHFHQLRSDLRFQKFLNIVGSKSQKR